MSDTGPGPAPGPPGPPGPPGHGAPAAHAAFTSLLEDNAEDLYENAPCGYLSTLLDGQIAKINGTLLSWLGYTRDELVGHRYFADLLTAGGRLYHETHFAPLLNMQGEIGGVALELRAADGTRLPVLVNSVVKTTATGQPMLIRTTIFDARDRRAYERELLRARQEADHDRERLQRLVTTLQRSLLPRRCPRFPAWTRPRTTTSPPPMRWGEISTTCSPWAGSGGACSSAMCAAKAPARRRPRP